MSKWQCMTCNWEYDEAVGDPEHGIPAGTKWEDIPADWICPNCGMSKEFYVLVGE